MEAYRLTPQQRVVVVMMCQRTAGSALWADSEEVEQGWGSDDGSHEGLGLWPFDTTQQHSRLNQMSPVAELDSDLLVLADHTPSTTSITPPFTKIDSNLAFFAGPDAQLPNSPQPARSPILRWLPAIPGTLGAGRRVKMPSGARRFNLPSNGSKVGLLPLHQKPRLLSRAQGQAAEQEGARSVGDKAHDYQLLHKGKDFFDKLEALQTDPEYTA
ncbi:uncharacterized protein PAC_02393 [Phialocephala subalpina]|uniref:Uncharacterized protein n=1 Tax=Phialocephala subalpina TaxID=576137 RepID=A0A1L7WIC5_9HELO|nr:uncharacterized protein PAC_02393 [Phialocephala subalpina]